MRLLGIPINVCLTTDEKHSLLESELIFRQRTMNDASRESRETASEQRPKER